MYNLNIEELTEMENNIVEQTKNKNLIIGIMACIILLLIAALVYFMFIKKDDEQPKNNNSNQQDNIKTNNNNSQQENENKEEKEEISYKPWMNYILEQNITSIELVEYPCSEDNSEKRTIAISTDQLKNIFSKFLNYTMRLSYTSGSGWECGQTLNIKYLKDGKTYELNYVPNYFIPSSSEDGNTTILDKDLENALYNSVDIKDESDKNQDGVYPQYDLVTNDQILTEFFK
jgi:hypothetical protein